MKLGIDLTPITPGASGGIAPLIEGVLGPFLAGARGHALTILQTSRGLQLKESPGRDMRVVDLGSSPAEAEVDRLTRNADFDVLFRTFPGVPTSGISASRQVVLIPDLQHEYFPEFFAPSVLQQRRIRFNHALAEAGAIATLSDHARASLRAHAATRCADIFLMSPALVADPHPPTVEDLTEFERAVLPVRDFFLYPANLWPHKNHRRVLQAFERLTAQGRDPVEFIFTGDPKGWAALASEFGHLPIRHLGYVRRTFLQVLMRRARALVYFSLFEGFGMPLLEAFDAGTPVVCSNTTSLPEVAGDAALGCSPTDIAAMCNCLDAVLHDHALRERLVMRGQKRRQCFTWETSARNLWDACARVAARISTQQPPPTEVAPAPPVPTPRPMTIGRIVRGVGKRLQHYCILARRGARKAIRQHWRDGLAVPHFGHVLQPRLGRFFMYTPRPLEVPADYLTVRPPQSPPTIALVTPSYNQAGFLERTLQSVLDQNYPRLQYVVQDGGSWDRTLDILERYRERLSHCESVKDQGQANAINLGFRHTTGEIMAYLNSDDLLLPGTLAYVAQYFANHPHTDVVYGHRIIIDEHDREVGRWVMPPHEDRALVWSDYVPQETLFWRRRIWDKVGAAMDESFQFALDWDLLLRFRAAGARFKRLPRFLGAFRIHHQQKTSVAIASTGARETDRLMLKLHGRVVPYEERLRRTRVFMGKHVILDKLYRWGWLSA